MAGRFFPDRSIRREEEMAFPREKIGLGFLIILIAAAPMAGCAAAETATQTPPTASPAVVEFLPQITGVTQGSAEVSRYGSVEWSVAVKADYGNPYDAREVRLDGVFSGPDGGTMQVPGFWDGEGSWRVRFTPSLEGQWKYRLTIADRNGAGLPAEGEFQVAASDLHGWIQAGNWIDPAFSGHYLVHQDGTPFYGLGHCDALNILVDGFDVEKGVGLFDQMKAAGENYVVWWPLYSMSPVNGSYDQYSVPNMKVIDLVVQDAQKKGIYLIFTIWDHPELRGAGHSWGAGRWETNGFSKLSDIDSFFTAGEPWAWQENLYRYIIARWGYSPAIGMWQTVSEINGTNAYDQTNPWHEKVNAYFVEHDPYRHPTTASMSGDVEWPEGHRAMDAPQVQLYDFSNGEQQIDAVHAGWVLAHWTQLMWNIADKPNWVGEFGVTGDGYYPELFHNSIWGALAAGAAMTPAEWNSGGTWGEMTPAMQADIGRLAGFVEPIPLAELNPEPVRIVVSDPKVRGWGVAGRNGGLFWVQDFALESNSIEDVRRNGVVRRGVQAEIQGLGGGTFAVTPYDTWQGVWLESFIVQCTEGQMCLIPLPDFKADMAFQLDRKLPA
jgi:hypothetical protein